MRILVLGAGAVGGYFGGRLAAAGEDVRFLVRPARAAVLAARGLRIESPRGDVAMPVPVATADTLTGSWDAILLTTKAYDLDGAIAAIRPAVATGTAILPLLNGLAHLDRLDAEFGPERVLGGVAYIAATLSPDGAIRHLNASAGLTFGERAGGPSERVRALAEAFAGARVDAPASPDILQDMWEKFVMLATLAGMTCLMRGAIGEIMAAADGEALMLELLDECEAVASAAGHPSRPQPRARTRAMLTERGSSFSASMHRDLEGGRRTEGEAILGDMLRRARSLGIAAPLLRAAACHLEVYERCRAR